MRRALLVVLGAVVPLAFTGVAHAAPECPDPAWVETPTGTDAQLRGLSAVDSRTAWVSGSRGTILRTTDRGRTWKSSAPAGTEALDFRDIEAFDAEHAVALSIGPGDASRIYRTDDGGESWRLSFQNTDPAAFYDCLAFFDHRRGLAMSDPVDGKFRLQSTSDGGRTWKPVPAEGMVPALEGEFGFAASGQCLTTSGPRDAWIATGGGARARVLHSGDGGKTWEAADTPLPSGASAGVFSVTFRDPRHGVAIGGDYAAPNAPGPAVALSADKGRTWRTPPEAPVGYRSGLAWLGNTVLAVGPGGSDVSPDGGRHWKSFDTGSLDSVDCARGACWASGAKGRAARLGTA
ncbi:oxidoreductase [Amycolatopsis keratiniphila]|uniref:WD40/YVTN/BNR-like repeat-containing protein n=1 Tax=Amycolatopsis keratiniphila TaxID=129921 RepID=UPI0033DAC70F